VILPDRWRFTDRILEDFKKAVLSVINGRLDRTNAPTLTTKLGTGTAGKMVKWTDTDEIGNATNTDAQVAATVTASHAMSHSITDTSNHTSTATAGRILMADSNGLPINSANTGTQLTSAVIYSHIRNHSIISTSDHSSTATSGQMLKANADGLPVDATNTDTDVASAVSLKHTQSHVITSTSDHTSTATEGKILKADSNGLPIDASNTDTEVSTAVGYLNQDVKTTASPQFAKVKTPIIYPASDSTTAVRINKADGTTPVINVDTTNKRVNIGTATAPTSILYLEADAPILTFKNLTGGTSMGSKIQFYRDTGALGGSWGYNGRTMEIENKDGVGDVKIISGDDIYLLPYSGNTIYGSVDSSQNMRIDATAHENKGNILLNSEGGKVGIGTTTPTAVLHIKAGTATVNTAPLKLTSGTLLTIPETGTVEFSNDRFYITNVSIRRIIDRSNDVIIESTTVADTTDETTVYTATIPANGLKAGNVIKISGYGQLSTHDAADALTINVYMGSTLISTATSTPKQVTNVGWDLESIITIRTTGATGTFAVHTNFTIEDTVVSVNTPSTVVDTTAAEDITIKFQWDNADAGNTAQIDQCWCEFKG
jgi:hypothetical protein